MLINLSIILFWQFPYFEHYAMHMLTDVTYYSHNILDLMFMASETANN